MIKGFLLKGPSSFQSWSYILYMIQYTDIEYEDKELLQPGKFIRAKKFDFVNVTAPFKRKVIQYLDVVDNSVKETGVCNLIINKKGILSGYNTDIDGFNKTLDRYNVNVKDKNALIIGNGATKDTISYCLKQKGINKIYVLSRTKKEKDEYTDEKDLPRQDIQIIINATPIGQSEYDDSPVNVKKFTSLEVCIDVGYVLWRNEFLCQAKRMRAKSINGRTMLCEQGKKAMEIFNGRPFYDGEWVCTKEFMDINMTNIILYGMPASGKTMQLKNIQKAKKRTNGLLLFRHFFDTDEMVEKNTNMSISTLIRTCGEKTFRREESKAVSQIYYYPHGVFALGGGTLLNPDNYILLSGRGVLVYLKQTAFPNYRNDLSRPFAKTKEEWAKLYEERKDMYEDYADVIIPAEEANAETIIEGVKNALANH